MLLLMLMWMWPSLSSPSPPSLQKIIDLDDVVVLQKIIDLADVNVALRYLKKLYQQFTFVTGCMM
jgi:hypothetical protein